MAQLMENKGEICAFDLHSSRVKLITDGAARLGLTAIKGARGDATRYNEKLGLADRVLCDVPCAGLGVIRRKPEIKYKEETAEMDLLPKKQLAILSASSEYVKPNGTLLYSTCTVNPEENEKVVNEFLKRYPWFRKEERTLLLPNVNGTDGFFICVMKRLGLYD